MYYYSCTSGEFSIRNGCGSVVLIESPVQSDCTSRCQGVKTHGSLGAQDRMRMRNVHNSL